MSAIRSKKFNIYLFSKHCCYIHIHVYTHSSDFNLAAQQIIQRSIAKIKFSINIGVN